MLIAAKDARRAYEKISVYEDTVLGRQAKIRRVAAQLEKAWPPKRQPRLRSVVRKASAPGGGVSPPTQTVTPAAVGVGAGTILTNEMTADLAALVHGKGGRQPGEMVVDTLRVVAWLRSTGHRLRWLAKQLDVSKAHMNNCMLGFSKLSPVRMRRLEALMAVDGGAVS